MRGMTNNMQDEHKDTTNIAIKGKQTDEECSNTILVNKCQFLSGPHIV